MRSWLPSATGFVFVLTASVVEAQIPAPDSLTENTSSLWTAGTEGAWTALISDDPAVVSAGSSSIKLVTDAPFDVWMEVRPQVGSWDFLSEARGGLAFSIRADNPSPTGFQDQSPFVRVYTGSSYFEYRSTDDPLNRAGDHTWVDIAIPFTGNEEWGVTTNGSPSLADVTAIRIYADTWDAGFTMWVDGLTFDVSLLGPQNLKGYARNGRVDLEWDAWPDAGGIFDRYSIYRSSSSFVDTTGMTPIATIADSSVTSYSDMSVTNGVSYHYAITASTTSGIETTGVESIGPRTPLLETDLQVTSMSRTPRYPRFDPTYDYRQSNEGCQSIYSAAMGLRSGQDASTKRWYAFGEIVTYTAKIRNRGTTVFSGTVGGVWSVDGEDVAAQQQNVNLQPGETVTFARQTLWDNTNKAIRFRLTNTDDRLANNAFEMDTKSVAFLSFIDETHLERFRAETPGYPDAHSDDIIDFLNNHMRRFNEMFAAAGTTKRVHFDTLEVIPDDAPDPVVNRIDFAIFPFRYLDFGPSLRLTGFYRPLEDIDYGLLHEMGHQLGLIDLYQMNVAPSQNSVSGEGYTAARGLMNGVDTFVSTHSADAMNRWQDTAHGYYGQYLYDMPAINVVRALDVNSHPIGGATIRVYQRLEIPGTGPRICAIPKFVGVTAPDGTYVLPNVPIDPSLVPTTFVGDTLQTNPFGYVAVIGNNGVFHIEIEKDGFRDYGWLSITELNEAFASGETQTAVFDISTTLGSGVQTVPPTDIAENNAADWSGFAQGSTASLFDDTTRVVAGSASVRFETDGAFDTSANYPSGFQARWDLRGVSTMRFSLYAENDSVFQGAVPWVRLLTPTGAIELRPMVDLLNQARFTWKEFIVPLAGGDGWSRTVSGLDSVAEVNGFEIHADTFGAGFTLFIDDVRFDPQPIDPLIDYNDDGSIDGLDVMDFVGDLVLQVSETDLNFDSEHDWFDVAIYLQRIQSGL